MENENNGILAFSDNFKSLLKYYISISKLIKYSRSPLELCPFEKQNATESIQIKNRNYVFYPYNSESIRDYGWGCAWRCIQTILNNYFIISKSNNFISFPLLFTIFGDKQNLLDIYQYIYPDYKNSNAYSKLLESNKWVPHLLSNGWAEPFIGFLCLNYFKIKCNLFLINGIPEFHNTPEDNFEKIIDFECFANILVQHFEIESALPIMIDDGIFALTILSCCFEEEKFCMIIADPHVQEKSDLKTCFYCVYLDKLGKKIKDSISDNQKKQLYHKDSYEGLYFYKKNWMVLIPQ